MTLSVPCKAKVNTKHCPETPLPRFIDDCQSLLPFGFIFQQDGAQTAKLAQDWIATNCSKFIGKDESLPNSPNVNRLNYL